MIKQGGVYVCEDTHTSYWGEFGGGYKREGTSIEFAKKCADMLHIDHIRDPAATEISTLPKNLLQVSFFNSQVILVKGKPAFNRLMVNVK